MISKSKKEEYTFKDYFFNLIYLFLIVTFLCLNISGCCFLNGYGINPSETNNLKTGEKAFFQKDYKHAIAIFNSMIEKNNNPDIKNTARYSLACTILVSSDNEHELTEAIETLVNWKPLKNAKMHLENPLLMIQALQKMTKAKNNEINTIVKNQNQKMTKMAEMIKKLQHQISELENIDQEIQKKRKTN